MSFEQILNIIHGHRQTVRAHRGCAVQKCQLIRVHAERIQGKILAVTRIMGDDWQESHRSRLHLARRILRDLYIQHTADQLIPDFLRAEEVAK